MPVLFIRVDEETFKKFLAKKKELEDLCRAQGRKCRVTYGYVLKKLLEDFGPRV